MFTTLIVQPLFNILVLIYVLLPGHNFGLAIILFTVLVRLALWPLVKRQLHQTKLMRQLQPDIKRIRQQTTKNGVRDRQQESVMIMELYKERGVSVFSSLKVMIIQLPILIGLYVGLQKILHDQHQIVSFSYPFIQHFSWMERLAGNIHLLDTTLFHVVDLTRAAVSPSGLYVPAMVLVVGSAIIQYFQSKQLLPTTKDSRSLRQIMKDAGSGKQADQSEVNEAVGRSTRYLFPVMVLLLTAQVPSALSLYWLVSGLVAYWQQSRVLNKDVDEMEALVDKPYTGKANKSGKAGAVSVPSTIVSTKPLKKPSEADAQSEAETASPAPVVSRHAVRAAAKKTKRSAGGSTVSRVIIDGQVVTGAAIDADESPAGAAVVTVSRSAAAARKASKSSKSSSKSKSKKRRKS